MRLSLIALFLLPFTVAVAGSDINDASGAKPNTISRHVRDTQPIKHYIYNPPHKVKHYVTNYQVFHGEAPAYVFEYRTSGSKYDILLTGLALYNLGRNSNFHNFGPDKLYTTAPGEMCKLRVEPFKSANNSEIEEARIDCNLMSSFIWDNAPPGSKQDKQHTLQLIQNVNGTGNFTATYLEDAVNVKGKSIKLKPKTICYMIRTFAGEVKMRMHVDCGVLEEFTRSSLQPSGAQCLTPHMAIVFNFLIIYLVKYYV